MANLRVGVSAILAGAVCLATSVQATETVASLVQINGTALVNQGEQYTTAREGMTLRTGDRVMVMEGGSAVLKFADGCTHPVDDNRVLTVGSAESCSSGTLAQDAVGPYYAAAGAGGAATAGLAAAGVLGTVVIVGLSADTGSDERSTPPSISP
jgi:hypothetical protein